MSDRHRGTMVRAVAAPAATVALRARLTRLSALSDRQRTWWALGGSVLLALLLRVPYLSAPLGRDEGGLTYIAQNWPSTHGSLYGAYWVDRPPLLIGLFRLASFGGDVGVRILGAVAAVALLVAVVLLARAVAGPRAGRIAGVLAAVLTGSISLDAVFTPGELLAAVPSTLSVLCLVLAHRSRQTRFVVAAGALSIIAVLVKQSFLDAGFAGVVFVVASAVSDREVRLRWPLAYVAGAAASLAGLLVWLAATRLSIGGFTYIMFGFRIELLHTLAASDVPLQDRLMSLWHPVWESGLLLAVLAAVAGILHLRRDRVLAITLGAWLAAATVGVLGGGSYFAHYLIGLVPVACVAAAVLIARAHWLIGVAAVVAFLFVALPTAQGGAVYAAAHTIHGRERAVGHYVRDHARPGETQYVLYARANVVYYAGLPQPYPYLWSLMVRAKPGARAQLQRLLGSPQRPTWLVQWQNLDEWQLDPGTGMDRVLGRDYRLAAIVCNHPIFVRSDRKPRPRLTVTSC
jgi:Dolichyl-phosphate-mannose-protein mannosyltransferase